MLSGSSPKAKAFIRASCCRGPRGLGFRDASASLLLSGLWVKELRLRLFEKVHIWEFGPRSLLKLHDTRTCASAAISVAEHLGTQWPDGQSLPKREAPDIGYIGVLRILDNLNVRCTQALTIPGLRPYKP